MKNRRAHFAIESWSIRALLLALVMAMVVPALAVFVVYSLHEFERAHDQAHESVHVTATTVAANLDLTLRDHEAMLRHVAQEFRGNPPIRAANFDVTQLTRQNSYILNFGVRDLRAENIYSARSNPTPAAEALSFPWVRNALNSTEFVANDAFLGHLSERWVTVLTYPVQDNAGQRTGFVNLSLGLQDLTKRVLHGIPQHSLVAIIDGSRRYMGRSSLPDRFIGRTLEPGLAKALSEAGDQTAHHPDGEGVMRLWSVVEVPRTRWRVAVGALESTLLAPALQRVAAYLVVNLIGITLILFLAWKIAALIAAPIVHLAQTARRVAGEDRKARARVDGPAEVGEVAEQFNAMLDTIEQQKEERQALADHYQNLLRNARDIVLLINEQGRIVEANEAALAAYGYDATEILNLNIRTLRPAETHGQIEAQWAAAQQAHGVTFETVHCRKDGSRFPVEVSSSVISVSGRTYRQSFVRDISERKLAEENLRSSETRFRFLIEHASVGMYVSRAQRFVYANPRMESLLGRGPGELVGLPFEAVVVHEDLSNFLAVQATLGSDTQVASYTLRARSTDGSVVELGIQEVAADFEGSPSSIGMAEDVGERNRARAEIQRYVEKLEHATEATLLAVARMVEQRDPYTGGHERRVGDLSAALGLELGLPEMAVKGLRLAGYVHDLGKAVLPAELLVRPTRLTPIEFELIKTHSRAGYDILKEIEFPWPLATAILQHHERIDGSGYPDGIKGAAILFEARIIAVADVVESMASHRPYRPSLGIDAALAEIIQHRGRLYDPQVVDACVRLFREKSYVFPDA